MTTITNADREAARKELDHLLHGTFSIPMAVEHLAQLRANDREQARREALEEAAALIDANTISHRGEIAELARRRDGDRFGLAFAAAIRALIGETK